MQAIGFFREAPHGLPQGPSLMASLEHPLEGPDRRRLAEYLRRCPVVLATSTKVTDVLAPESGDLLSIDIHTDGQYVWPDQCAHYVERYGARLSAEFVKHALRQAHVPSREELAEELIGEIQSAMRSQR